MAVIPLKVDIGDVEHRIKSVESQIKRLHTLEENAAKQNGANIGAIRAHYHSLWEKQMAKMPAISEQVNAKMAESTKRRHGIELQADQNSLKQLEKIVGQKFEVVQSINAQIKAERLKDQTDEERSLIAGLNAKKNAAQEELEIYRKVRNQKEGSWGKSLAGAFSAFGHSGAGEFAKELAPGLGKFAGAAGIAYGMKEAVEEGIKLTQVESSITAGFLQNGRSVKEVAGDMKSVNEFAEIWSEKLVVSQFHLKELVRDASLFGGFTGKAAEEVAKMAGAVEKQSGGNISGEMFTRAISQRFIGIESGTGNGTLGRLAAQFPTLNRALAGATTSEEVFARTVAFTNTLVKQQGEFAETTAGRIERAAERGKDSLGKIGQWMLGAIDSIGMAEARLFGTNDPGIKVRILTEDIAKAKKEVATFGDEIRKGHLAKLQKELDDLANKSPEAKEQLELLNASIKKNADNSNIAQSELAKEAARVGFLVSEYTRLKGALDNLDAKRSEVTLLEQQGADALDRIAKGQGTVWDVATVKLNKYLIKIKGRELATNAKHFKEMELSDPSVDHETGKSLDEIRKGHFEKALKSLEDKMKNEQAVEIKYGLENNRSKESIEVAKLRIQIKYDALIAEAAKKNIQLSAQYLEAGKEAELRIWSIQNDAIKKYQEEQDKSAEIHFRFQVSVASDSDKKKLELADKFQKDTLTLRGEFYDEELAQLWAMYKKEYTLIVENEADLKQKKISEAQKRLFESQQKGIELRIKANKDNSSVLVELEDLHYKKELEIQRNYYEQALIDAKKNGADLKIVRTENNNAIQNIDYEHTQKLREIQENSIREIKDAIHSSTKNLFSDLLGGEQNVGQRLMGNLKKSAIDIISSKGADLLTSKNDNEQTIQNAVITITNARIDAGTFTGQGGTDLTEMQQAGFGVGTGWGVGGWGSGGTNTKTSKVFSLFDTTATVEDESEKAKEEAPKLWKENIEKLKEIGEVVHKGSGYAEAGWEWFKKLKNIGHADPFGVATGFLSQQSVNTGGIKGIDWGNVDLSNTMFGNKGKDEKGSYKDKENIEAGMLGAFSKLQGKQNKPAGISGSLGFLDLAVPGLGTGLSLLGGIFGFSEGGIVPQYLASGGAISPYIGMPLGGGKGVHFRSKGTDTIPAMLSPGETVRTVKQESDLNRQFAMMASYSSIAGGSYVGNMNETNSELRGLRNDIKHLEIGVSSTRQIQLANKADSLVHSFTKY